MKPGISEVIVIWQLWMIIELCFLNSFKGTRTSVQITSGQYMGWDTSNEKPFDRAKNQLKNITSLEYPDSSKFLCLSSDTSRHKCASHLFKHPLTDFIFQTLMYQPLHFSSRFFSGSAASWSIIEKEALAIVHSFSKSSIFNAAESLQNVLDHRNLITIFNPGQDVPDERSGLWQGSRLEYVSSDFQICVRTHLQRKYVWEDLLSAQPAQL